MTPSAFRHPGQRPHRLAWLALVSALFIAVFLTVAGAPGRAEAASVPAGAAQSAAAATSGQGLVQDVQWRRYGYGPRRYYGRGYYRPRYGYYRPAYRPRVVCRIRYGVYGPRRVCFRR